MDDFKKVLNLFLITAITLAVLGRMTKVPSVHGGYLYDGDEEKKREIYVDKSVSLPRENNEGDLIFKDNLSDIEGERYKKDQIVVFEIRVKNVGDETISKVIVRDKFPEYVDFPSDGENWDDATHTYTYEIYDLEPGEEDIRTIEGRITTDTRICVVNTVEAEPDEGDSDTDTATLCTDQAGEVLGVQAMPEAGTSPLFVMTALALAGFGAYVNKKK
jgi:hypothetical protein